MRRPRVQASGAALGPLLFLLGNFSHRLQRLRRQGVGPQPLCLLVPPTLGSCYPPPRAPRLSHLPLGLF